MVWHRPRRELADLLSRYGTAEEIAVAPPWDGGAVDGCIPAAGPPVFRLVQAAFRGQTGSTSGPASPVALEYTRYEHRT
ncbi:hypothetical protein GCM10009830_19800 [Glycomyces endophyticus]|uniref:Uncharacterized protein n=1 Tax=Glycomyces endophyticus TaxID=480996 RepID=A0ABN2GMG4_9ACTN